MVICKGCNEMKELDDFYNYTGKREGKCKKCRRTGKYERNNAHVSRLSNEQKEKLLEDIESLPLLDAVFKWRSVFPHLSPLTLSKWKKEGKLN